MVALLFCWSGRPAIGSCAQTGALFGVRLHRSDEHRPAAGPARPRGLPRGRHPLHDLTKRSLLPKMAKQGGSDFPTLMERILASATL